MQVTRKPVTWCNFLKAMCHVLIRTTGAVQTGVRSTCQRNSRHLGITESWTWPEVTRERNPCTPMQTKAIHMQGTIKGSLQRNGHLQIVKQLFVSCSLIPAGNLYSLCSPGNQERQSQCIWIGINSLISQFYLQAKHVCFSYFVCPSEPPTHLAHTDLQIFQQEIFKLVATSQHTF